MQIDKAHFLVNVLECNKPTILVWPEQAKFTMRNSVVIGEPRKDEKR
jgi:hypothetical protein